MQIIQRMLKSKPFSIKNFHNRNVSCTPKPSCLPFLSKKAAESLQLIAAQLPNKPLIVQSALRTANQQYLLRKWKNERRCGITEAAVPGQSNHESLQAIDISNEVARQYQHVFEANGWERFKNKTNVAHFDFNQSTPSLQTRSLIAFQQLWNENTKNSNREIPTKEYGKYSSKTIAALYDAPCDGW